MQRSPLLSASRCDFLRGLYACRNHRRQRHLRSSALPPSPIFPAFLSISIAPLLPHPVPRTLSDFYLLHAFAEEFTSVVCDPGHRVPHPLIKDCATDVPSPRADMSLLRINGLDLSPSSLLSLSLSLSYFFSHFFPTLSHVEI